MAVNTVVNETSDELKQFSVVTSSTSLGSAKVMSTHCTEVSNVILQVPIHLRKLHSRCKAPLHVAQA